MSRVVLPVFKVLKLLCLVVLLPLIMSCRATTGQDEEADIAAISAMSAVRAKAFNEGDAAAIAVHFTEDGLLMAPGYKASSGRGAVEAYYQSIFDEYLPELKSGYDEVKVSGDLAYGRGFAEVKLIPRTGGEPVFSTAKYINILQRQPDGSWLTTHDIWNGNEED